MMEDTIQLIDRSANGDGQAASQLMPLVYEELRKLAGSYLVGGAQGVTLQPTLLVHEAYLRLVRHDVGVRGRSHFFALAATAMRCVLIDHVRGRKREKRGGQAARVSLSGAYEVSQRDDVDAMMLEDAIDELAKLDPRGARGVEMRFFGGMTEKEIAEALGVSERTVQNDWRVARAWLRRALGQTTPESSS